ncbi:MAG: hypothetical protein KC912_16580 [Proteobacteria bacterium]|nr:hypothetical protein [Pseudomonadota bacterium]
MKDGLMKTMVLALLAIGSVAYAGDSGECPDDMVEVDCQNEVHAGIECGRNDVWDTFASLKNSSGPGCFWVIKVIETCDCEPVRTGTSPTLPEEDESPLPTGGR